MAVAFGFTSAVAQDLTSKKGEQMLPEAGDWSIGVDATPFLEYAGNFFGKSAKNNAPTWDFMSGQNILGKYYADAATAYRVGLRIGLGSVTQRNVVSDRTFNPSTPNNFPSADPTVENAWKQSYTNIGLSVGMEKRKGKTRLQGYYGGEVGIYFANTKDAFTYGNSLNASTTPSLVVDVDPTDDVFTGAGNIMTGVPATGAGTGRVTERKNGSTFGFGLRGFIGCEFFILPKVSLGGEFGWGLGLSTTGAGSSDVESIGNNDPFGTGTDVVGSTTVEGAKQGTFQLDTDNTNSLLGASGTLRLNFHF